MKRSAPALLVWFAIFIITADAIGIIATVQTGTWQAMGSMVMPRSAATAVLLQDHRVLIAGGNNAGTTQSSAEVFNLDGSFSAVPLMATPRASHVSVVLKDGRVLVAGGTTAGNAATNSAEIFTPGVDTWAATASAMVEARSGATATVLADGRILIAGGQNAGVPSQTAEIFDPTTGQFGLAGTLSTPRMGLASALLADGRVLIAGGFNGSAPLNTTDIFDPTTNTISAGPALTTARVGHSATSLLDGRVLVAGGNNGSADVSSAEIYDPATGAFAAAAASLAVPRRDHTAILLPNNNSILILGGTSNGNETNSAEMFTPWTGTFANTGALSVARQQPATSALSQDGLLLTAGGTSAGATVSSAELYGFATVKTDAADYPPGSVVTITGTGWQPGETVTLTLVESPLIDTHGPFTTTADSAGNISNNSFVTDTHDVNVRFSLTAVGSQSGSQAQNTFTDNISLKGVSVGPQSGAATYGTSASPTFLITATYTGNGGTNVDDPVGLTFVGWTGTAPAGVSTSFSSASVTIGSPASTLTITTSAPTQAGSYTFTVRATGKSGSTATSSGTLTVNQRPIAVSAAANTKGYDGTTSATATPTITSGSLASGDTGTFSETYDTKNAGNGKTLTPTGTIKNSSNTDVTSSYSIAFASAATGVINTRAITVTAATNTKGYDGAASAAATPSVTSGSLAAGDTANFTETYDTKNVGTGKTLTPTGSVSDGNSGNNYSVTYANNTTGVITARAITVTAAANSKTYDGTTSAAATPTVTTGSLATGDTGNFTETYDTKNVGTNKTLTPTGSVNDGNSGSNYTVIFTAANTGTITARAIAATAATNTKSYDGTTSATATPTITSGTLANGDTANFTEAYSNKNAGTGKTLIPSGSVSDGNSGNNYTITFSNNTTGVITARAITVTAATNAKNYDGTTSATATPTITSGTLASGDSANFTEAYASKNVGTNLTLTPAGSVSDGNSGNNYTVTFANNTTGVITARTITAMAATNTKGYDGTTSAAATPTITSGTLASGDTANFVETYGTKNVGTGLTLTPSGSVNDGNNGNNYAVTFASNATGVITARSITVTAQMDNKQYDGTTTSAVTPVVTSGSILAGDTGNFTQIFDTKNVGNHKMLTPAGAVSDGNGGNNYAITFAPSTNGTIHPRAITVTAFADTKVYDGTTSSAGVPTITSGSLAPGDSASFSQTFDTKNVGTGKTLTPAGTVNDGNGGNNYSVIFTVNTSGVITARPMTVTAVANTKVYDATTSATATPTITSGSLASGDTASFSEVYSTKNVGTNLTLTSSGTVNDGNNGNNYSVSFVSTNTGTITARALTVTAATNTKTYDGTTSAVATPTITSGVLQGTDTANFTEVYDTKGVGTGKTLTPSGAVSDGNGGNNYAVTFVTNTSGVINKRAITVTAASDTKTYDGTTASSGTPMLTSGSLAALDTAHFTQTFDSKNASAVNGRTLTPAGTISDALSADMTGNYAITFASASGTINKAALTITAATNTKTYDGTTSAAATPGVTGAISPDTVTALAEVYSDASAGSGKALTVSAYTVNDGNGGNNYTVSTVANSTGVINKANATIAVTPYSMAYDGNAHTATGSAQGVLNENLSGLDLSHTTHTNAATYNSDYWTFTDGTGNYNNVAATTITDTINKATPVVGVSFAASPITYDGNSHPASASASGVGGADLSGHGTLTVTYTPGGSSAPVNAGSYTASAQFVSSDGNYTDAASGTPASLTINQASSTTTVHCPASVTYNASLQTPCSASVTGTGNLSQSLTVTYGNNMNAGTASASASFAGDTNHAGSNGSVNFTILQATPAVSFTGAPASATFGAQFVVTATTSSTADAMISASGSCAISGTTVTITSGVGICNLHAAWPADGNYFAAAADQSTAAQPVPVAITVPDTTVTYDGSPKTVSVTASPAVSFSVTFTGTGGTSFGPSATAPTEPGTYTVFATVTDAVDYVGSSSGTLIISKKVPALVFALRTGMPAQTAYGTRVYFDLTTTNSPCPTGLVQFFIDSDSTPSSTATLTETECTLPVSAEFSTATLTPGTHTVYVTYAGDAHYLNETSAQVSQVVVADATMVTLATSAGEVFVGDPVTFAATVTPSTSVDANATAPAGTVQFFDGSTQLGQSALTGNTATLSTSSLPAGPHSVTATYISANGDFTGSSSPVSVETVDKITPTINWPTPAAIVYGTKLDNAQLNATATDAHNGVPVSGTFVYNPPADTVLAVGPFNLTVTFTPTDGNTFTTQTASVTITVNPATLTVTADNTSRSYGADNPPFTFQYAGFVNNEASAVIATPPTCTSAADRTSSVGTYDITCSGGVSPNYTFNYVKGILTVDAATLAITAKDANKTYGSTLTFAGTEFTTSALYNSDTVTGVTLASAGAPASAAAGSYSIVPSAAAGTGLTNYTITYKNGTLTVDKAHLAVTADDKNKTFDGAVFSSFTATISGFVNGENLASSGVTGSAGFAGAATTAVNAGSYTIIPTAGTLSAANYDFTTFSNGTLTIKQATPAVTVTDPMPTYDGNPHSATATAIGVDGHTAVNGNFTFTYDGNATAPINAKTSYVVVATFTSSDPNYKGATGNGALTIKQAIPTVTVSFGSSAITYDGNSHPAAVSVTGVGGADLASGHGTVTVTYTPGPGAPMNAGGYTASAHFASSDGNYTDADSSTAASLTINKADPVITAAGGTFTYDGNPHAGTATATGVKGEALAPVNIAYTVVSAPPRNPGDLLTSPPVDAGSYQVAARFAGNSNYNQRQSAAVPLTINKADAVITVNGYTGVYDGNAHGAIGSAHGVESPTPADLSSLLHLGSTFTNVPGGTAHWTFDGNNDYNAASGDASVVITQADAIIKINDYSGIYDGNAHGATGSATGVKGEDLSSLLNLGSSFANVPGGTANWAFAGNTDYKSASGSASISISKANAAVSVTPYSVTYDGNPHTATGTATGAKNEALAGLDVTHTIHTGAGVYSNDYWTFTDATGNYNNAGPTSITDTINKATPVVAVSFNPSTITYDGNPHPASAIITGVGGILPVPANGAVTISYKKGGMVFAGVPIDAASFTASAHFASSNGNYMDADSSVEAALTINQADAAITVNGYTGVYDGNAHGATGSAKGVQNEDLTNLLSLGANFNDVPGGTANWSFAGNTDYKPSGGSVAINITQADAVVTVNGYTGVYDANPHAATGSAKGVKSEDLTVLLTLGANFTNVPGGTAHWTFAGNVDYKASAGDVPISITQASSTTVVTCPPSVTFNGSAQTPCSASVMGVGGLSLTPTPSYGNNVNVGSATASYTFGGDANHTGSSDSKNFTISQASATTVVTCPAGETYNGAAQTPCTAVATGAGGLNQSLTAAIVYSNNINVGTASANASFAGDANHSGSNGSAIFTISKANQTITWNAPATMTYGAPLGSTQLNATVAGATGGSAPGALTYTPPAGTVLPAGSSTLTVNAAATSNYNAATKQVTIQAQYLTGGMCAGDAGHAIRQPINLDGSSVFKFGSTVPTKFAVCDANGNSVSTAGLIVAYGILSGANTPSITVDEDIYSTTPDTAFRWDPTGAQWIFNQGTKNNPSLKGGSTFYWGIKLNDGTWIYFQYGLK